LSRLHTASAELDKSCTARASTWLPWAGPRVGCRNLNYGLQSSPAHALLKHAALVHQWVIWLFATFDFIGTIKFECILKLEVLFLYFL
jgi:hypothetical protein